MKTLTLLAISGISLCAAPSIQAQEETQDSKNRWTFGVKAGVNSSTFTNDSHNIGQSGVIGLNGGLTVEYALRNNFFLSSGLEFSTKGGDATNSSYQILTSETGTYVIHTNTHDSRTFNYLQLPLTLGYRVPISKKVNLTFNAGAYFGVNVYGKGSYKTHSQIMETDGTNKWEFNETKANKTGDTDFGLLGGVGVEYKKFSFNLNYEFGLRNLHTAETSDNQTGDAWKNRNATFSVGYKF